MCGQMLSTLFLLQQKHCSLHSLACCQ